jgi:S-(hydroxymethyl)glutathione dehydrogenase/alcohol dehydrogenase
MEGKIGIDDPVAHTLHPDRIDEGFDQMKQGESIRPVVFYP